VKLLDRFERAMAASALREDSDFWYQPVDGAYPGASVTPETALRQSTVLACVSLKSGLLSSLPLLIYKRSRDGGRTRATDHPLYEVLHTRPNSWMTASEFKRLIGMCLYLRGNFYAIIVAGPRGFADTLIPVHPSLVQVKQLSSRALVYRITDPATGETKDYAQDDIFHVRDFSTDGIVGLSRITQQREGIGAAMAAQAHGAAVLRNGGRPGGVLSTDKTLSQQQRTDNLKAWNETHGGASRGGTALLDGGAKFQVVSMTNEDAQYIEQLRYGACDIARIFGVPPHLIGETDKSTSWGTGIEQQNIGFLTFSLMPDLVAIEDSIGRDLILNEQVYYAEFLVDALLRADFATRMAGYGVAIDHGIMCPDEGRSRENLNARTDGRGKIFWRPANMVPDDGTVVPTAIAPKPNGNGAHAHLTPSQAEEALS
jgi:HK97 family phage portal protein